LYFSRQYEPAIRELQALVQMDPTFARGQWRLGQVLLVQGRYDEAIPRLQTAAALTQRAPAVVGLLAMAFGGRGQVDKAQQIVGALVQRSTSENVPPGASLLAYLGIKDKSAAIDVLERVYADRDGYAIYVDADPLMDPLRDDPRFQALCRQVMLGTASHTTEL